MPTVLKSHGECQAVLGGQIGGGTWVLGDDRQRKPPSRFFFWSENSVLQKQSMLEFLCLYSVGQNSVST